MKKKSSLKLIAIQTGIIAMLPLIYTLKDVFRIFDIRQNGFGVETIILMLSIIATLTLTVLLFLLSKNFLQNKILTKENFEMIQRFSLCFILLAAACEILGVHFDINIDFTRYGMMILAGIILNTLAFALKIGIKLQEKQDLTI